MKILFIGNSHTFVHYVPLRVKRYLEARGEAADVTMLTHPGMGLDYHLKQSTTYLNLIYGGYDAVVLQHVAHPFPGRESLLESGRAMAALVPASTRVFLFMTWSEKKNPGGQAPMSAAYEELAGMIGATVCPVGRIWWQVREGHPDELYFPDGEHASVFGASLAAAVIARTLLGKATDPEEAYREAKLLEGTECDPRMIDLVLEDGQYAMRPIREL